MEDVASAAVKSFEVKNEKNRKKWVESLDFLLVHFSIVSPSKQMKVCTRLRSRSHVMSCQGVWYSLSLSFSHATPPEKKIFFPLTASGVNMEGGACSPRVLKMLIRKMDPKSNNLITTRSSNTGRQKVHAFLFFLHSSTSFTESHSMTEMWLFSMRPNPCPIRTRTSRKGIRKAFCAFHWHNRRVII